MLKQTFWIMETILRNLHEPSVVPDIIPAPNFNLNSIDPPAFRPFKPKYHLTMETTGIETVDRNDLILFDNTYAERLCLRESLLQQYSADVIGVTSETDMKIRLAVQELYIYLFATYLPKRYPKIFEVAGKEQALHTHLKNRVTGNVFSMHIANSTPLRDALKTIAENVDEDFFILFPHRQEGTNEEIYILEAYAACFPSGFQPRDKIGKQLADIHGPVPGYKQKLQKSMDRFFARLEPGRYVKRVNWGVTVDEELFSNFDKSKPAFEGTLQKISLEELKLDKTYLRCERQTLHRLPASGAIVFGFHTYIYPIQDIKAEGNGELLAQAIDGLEHGSVPEMFTYKGGGKWAGSVREYLRG
ncbi:Uncharacterized protein PECH_008280 [Penicillium ucsense]|uniref:DUF3445 domain-containing protein n=1 Tax=Penicillium ucsense TaxID=2839758 RepID=A0A8J8WHP0_9EURO|nr:Uncharacterized protein PECM_007985 [Penicillium ucsense]KAF7734263.1 Uncharacterized protein PECH_008280 [Penicillium ucsense]